MVLNLNRKRPELMGRRQFVALSCGLAASVFASGHILRRTSQVESYNESFAVPPIPRSGTDKTVVPNSYAPPISGLHPDHAILDNLATKRGESDPEPLEDIVIPENEKAAFTSALARLARLQSYVGYGNFNVIGWDQSLRMARNRDQVGEFTQSELDFIERLFFTNAATLGFYGDKVVTRLSSTIEKKDVIKIAGSGHYLFKGHAADTYRRIRKDVGESIVLTSGIRGIVKQIFLFLNKAAEVNGNLSVASYSLAPPGHSYHALGDFDVGKKGWGHKNFSADFVGTDEFKRLVDLGYLDIRYPQDNPFGVRYEPWHIKVV